MVENLVKKIFWTEFIEDFNDLDMTLFHRCQELEKKGFGMLANKLDKMIIDDSDSIVCPDGTILTPKQVMDYLDKRKGSYSSKNMEDVKVHNAQMYYIGFKAQ